MSWVIIVSISYVMLTMDGGIVNELLVYFGFEKINFLLVRNGSDRCTLFRSSGGKQDGGRLFIWRRLHRLILQLYEAARMDGAGRIRQIWHITLPAIRSVIIVLLILKIGDVLELGFEHVYLLLNSMNRNVAEIIDTYVYTAGLKQGQFSYSTAIGLFKSFIGLIMVMLANKLAKKDGRRRRLLMHETKEESQSW